MDYISKTTHDGRNVRVKDYKKRVRRNRRRRKILFFSFLLLCVIAFLRLSPIFDIKEIRCGGNSVVTGDEIISASTISLQYNIFRTSLNKASKLISAVPYIKTVKIKRKLPNIIDISVKESGVYGYIPLNEGYIYIDENCKMLEFNTVPPKISVPVIQGTGVQSFEGGKKLVCDDDKKAELIIAAVKELQNNSLYDKTTVIEVPAADKLSLFYNNRLEVFVGMVDDMEYKINFAGRIINDKLGENAKGFLDVSNPESDSYYRENK